MSLDQQNKILFDRAQMLRKSREFFFERNITEVDIPILSEKASVDTYIDLLKTIANEKEYFLHSSPEYGMKKLLADGSGDIYQISHVFRNNEISKIHLKEFTMVEWYRCNMTFEKMMQETADFANLFIGSKKCSFITYRKAFQKFGDIDYLNSTPIQIKKLLKKHGIDTNQNDKDELLNLLLGCIIEPHLGKNEICILYNYPATQSALARTENINGEEVAKRFELYYKGMELANGYYELACPKEQLIRLQSANKKRKALGKEKLPIDNSLIKALEKGLANCCGVAVGFDRLMMLRHKKNKLQPTPPFC